MTSPQRIQLRRTKGWRKPEGAAVVARPSRWGNPFRVGDRYLWIPGQPWPIPTSRKVGEWEHGIRVEECPDRATAVEWYQPWIGAVINSGVSLDPLAGRDLACWCPLDAPCHGDVLLELANGGRS
jgi:hypothetical protein